MKAILIFFTCIILSSTTELKAQSSVDKMFEQIKKTEQYEGISIPGWLFRLGLSIAAKDDMDISESGLLELSKKIKKIKIATTNLDLKKYNTKAILNNFAKSVHQKDRFEEYVSVREEDQHLKIMVQENDDVIKNVVILSEDKGDIAVIHIKSNLTMDDLKRISFSKLKNESISNQSNN
jgi:hypothetical protein